MKRKLIDKIMSSRERRYCTKAMLESRDWSFFIKAHMRQKGVVGMTIEGLRKLSGLSQVKLAQEMGVNQASISRIEMGKYAITDVMREKLAEVFGCSISLFAEPMPSTQTADSPQKQSAPCPQWSKRP